MSRSSAWIASLVWAPARHQKIDETRSSASPESSSAASVLSIVGASGLPAIASISPHAPPAPRRRPARNRRRRCGVKSGRPSGPVHAVSGWRRGRRLRCWLRSWGWIVRMRGRADGDVGAPGAPQPSRRPLAIEPIAAVAIAMRSVGVAVVGDAALRVLADQAVVDLERLADQYVVLGEIVAGEHGGRRRRRSSRPCAGCRRRRWRCAIRPSCRGIQTCSA